MRIKTDYMGNDQLLPAYNVQIGVADEYIAVVDMNHYHSDMDCFVPLMEHFKQTYGFYPQYPVADAGYGSYNNYIFCEQNGIEKYMKFPMFKKETTEASCKKKVERLWISSMEDSAIKEGFSHLRDGSEYNSLFASAQARDIADWLVGMNISRLYSCLYPQNYSVGRVQTPTLAMIVKRNDEIAHFKKEKYYTVDLLTDGFSLSSERIDDIETAKRLKNKVGNTIKVCDVTQKEKITNPELPFDLTTLQRECNKFFGYSAKQTLEYAQSLYEKKFITYPRTDSRCLTEDMVVNTLNNIVGKNDFDKERVKAVFNLKKVTDHYAIITTRKSLNLRVQTIAL